MKRKHPARIYRLIFVLCLLASANIVQARHASDKAYKGGNFTLEFGAFTSAGYKVSFPGFSLTPVGGYTFSEHLFLGGGVSFCFNTVGNFFSMSTPVFVRGKYSLLKSRITPYVLLDAGYDPLFVFVDRNISESVCTVARRPVDICYSRRFLSSARIGCLVAFAPPQKREFRYRLLSAARRFQTHGVAERQH